MSDLLRRDNLSIQPMSHDAVMRVSALEQQLLSLPQVDIITRHILHAGMYARTITIPPGVVLTGAFIKRATLLTISGDVLMSLGDADGIRITGTSVVPASAGRKQVFMTYAETTVTMIFPTAAKTIEQAEEEFTDDTDKLFSRSNPSRNEVIITGE